MGFYEDRVLPRIIDKMCGVKTMVPLRRRATTGLSGTVLEIGFGSGHNVPLYPDEVDRVVAVDPAAIGRQLAAKRLAGSRTTVDFVGLDAQALPLEDASVDEALSTFTLCTIPNEPQALREIHRVLRPGGRFHVLEHGLAPDPKVVRWQRRLEPINRRLAGGCHLTRDHWQALRDAGFTIELQENEYVKGPKPFSYFYIGVARKAA
ncbi:MAG TPA: methyltransferase domain-containing protein [Acidimicrobiales bacterium]|jgi:ubiquinone/menaquinone biosynthesis C-methylase UbiE|nr:methyltransferase domain-containing protein [Acidimicrobiales bacterium]